MGWVVATKITREVLESYLHCKTKAHLKLAGQQGIRSDYEALLAETRQEVRRQAIDKIFAPHVESEVARNISLSAAALREKPSFVIDAILEDDLLSFVFDGLKRVDGPSKLGDFHYVPMLCHEGRKVGKEQRLRLEIYGLLLSQIQGRLPAYGLVWHGRECKSTKVRPSPDVRKTDRLLQEVKEMARGGAAPRLILNNHCQVCEFQHRCHDQAIQEDNISLLRGMHWYLHNSQFFVTCSVARDWAAFNGGGSLVNFSVTMDRPQCEGPPHNEGSGEISTRAEGVVAHGVILLLHVDLENRIPRGLTLT